MSKTKIKSKDENPEGLHARYYIEKTDGSPLDPRAEYFVLRLDTQGDPDHVRASRMAVMTYAREIRGTLPELASDIEERYGIIERTMKDNKTRIDVINEVATSYTLKTRAVAPDGNGCVMSTSGRSAPK